MEVIISKKLLTCIILLIILEMVYLSYLNLNREKQKINVEDYFTNL